MTTNDIDAIRKLTDAADSGPWRVVEEHGRDIADEAYSRITIQTAIHYGKSGEIAELVDPDHDWASKLTEENADFIAAARTHVPALCDEIEQLRAERDAMAAHIKHLDEKLTAEIHRADGLAADVRTLTTAQTAYANENARLRSQLAEAEADRDRFKRLHASLADACSTLHTAEVAR